MKMSCFLCGLGDDDHEEQNAVAAFLMETTRAEAARVESRKRTLEMAKVHLTSWAVATWRRLQTPQSWRKWRGVWVDRGVAAAAQHTAANYCERRRAERLASAFANWSELPQRYVCVEGWH